jgi:RNA polymerase sigma-70 factor (ECF subfamily)
MAEHKVAAPSDPVLHFAVLRCQAGDERAFAKLMEQFGPRTHSYLRGLVSDAADDVQQEVWLAVYRNIASLADPGAFRTWLFRITRHRALDFLRRAGRERDFLADAALEASETAAPITENDGSSLSAAMRGALERLPAMQREVLLLRYMNDLSYGEIALIVGCSVGTVRSRLHYAKHQLHDLIDQRP